MKIPFEDGVEDVRAAVRDGRAVREHGPYGVLIGDEHLHYTPAVVSEAEPTGDQILEAAGKHPTRDFLLYRMLDDGLLEEIRPEEKTDLRRAGTEEFLAFRSDRSFRFELDQRAFDWGASHISGRTLKQLAGIDVTTHDVFFVPSAGEMRLIGDKELFDLATPGVERFVTKPIDLTIFVNTRSRQVHHRRLSYWQVVRLAFPDAQPDPKALYTVIYSNGPVENPSGHLLDGRTVWLKDRMNFNVTPTDQS